MQLFDIQPAAPVMLTRGAVLAIAVLAIAALGAAATLGALLARRAARPGQAGPPDGQETSAMRRLRLASQEMRGIGMALHGRAGHAGSGASETAQLAGLASDLFDIADDLHEFTLQTPTRHTLKDEPIVLSLAVAEAVATVTASIGPGRRQWRIAPDVSATHLQADRRALRHVLTRVLSVVVRNTGEDDLVDIAVQPCAEGLALSIGSAAPAQAGPRSQDGAAVDMRLTLARSLMEAHGGRLAIAEAASSGGGVSLIFPATRIRGASIATARGSLPSQQDGKSRAAAERVPETARF